jgi:nitroimidazol reductase NimA-like FMN-containing flavoprotein (pyridoxamine 5'-phosphate oxidase superfamily)
VPDPEGVAASGAVGDGHEAAPERAPTERTRLRRLPEQGSHRREDLHAVLDAGFVCHLGLVVDDGPMVVPTSYGRAGDSLYLHGSAASRSLRAAKRPTPVCVTVTLVDGVVLARSVFNHSVNYRCAMVYGTPEVVTERDEKLAGLRTISEHVAPGQWAYARFPSDKELAATTVLRLALGEASVKISQGPPDDGDGPDGLLEVWAGEIPVVSVRLDPVADPTLRPGIAVPGHLRDGAIAPGTTHWRDLTPG